VTVRQDGSALRAAGQPLTLVLPAKFKARLGELPGSPRWYETAEEALDLAAGCDVVWVSGFTSAEVIGGILRQSDRLKWFHYSSTGVEHLPLALFRERGVLFTNGAGLYSQPIAEHVVMCVLAARLNLLGILRAQAASTWLPEAESDQELDGSVALILGYGELGRAVATRLRALGVTVLASRRSGEVSTEDGVVDAGEWRGRLPETDFLILTLPGTKETRGIIGAAELASMKPGSWLVNVARGSLVDEGALLAALTSGPLGGAALDALPQEPLSPEHPFWQMPNVILSPHSSYKSWRLAEREADRFLANLGNFVAHHPLRNVVDPDAGY
jgi:phosphoglycerate dehydrogenase-like enzyme